jgi:SAM-dependent methyltransferase
LSWSEKATWCGRLVRECSRKDCNRKSYGKKSNNIKEEKSIMENVMESLTKLNEPLEAIKRKQQTAWASGDYSIIGITLQIVGEMLCKAVDLQAGQRVLDVAAGNGNATLAAARRWAEVTALDYVPALLERAKERATVERLVVTFRGGDAENIPYRDDSFDVVLSTFGVMFSPNQERAAQELLRVCAPGGKIGLANWTPEGFIGQLFKIIGKYVPPMPGVKSPALWGTPQRLTELFGVKTRIQTERRHFVFRYKSPDHWLEIFRSYYGPVLKTYAVLDVEKQENLTRDIHNLLGAFNSSPDKLTIASEYLEVVVSKN